MLKEIITNENTIKNEDIIINKQGTDEHTIKNEDIITNKVNPSIIAKYTKNNGEYNLETF